MSFKSKTNAATLAAGVLLGAGYLVYALGRHAPAPNDLQSWAAAILIFIGIGIGAAVLAQIAFHIALAVGTAVKENGADEGKIKRAIAATVAEDEMDKLIALKSTHFGYMLAGLGFVAALVALVCGAAAVNALHILFGASLLGSLAEGALSIWFYEKGVRK
ncbi:MAG: hypothetical protein LBL66_02050 [Clostridiales bacterium]|nr:hypothetical protein [Clostridiales bacterium]